MKLKKLGALCIAMTALSTSAFAACTDSGDACAPKKTLDAWEKSLALGLNYTSGNSDTTVITGLANASRETKDDLTLFSAAYGYGEDRQKAASGDSTTNRNDTRVAGAYKYNLTDIVYAGGGVSYLHDQVADISYRVTVNPTVGAYLLKDADFKLGLEAGPSYVFEKVGGEKDDYFAPRVADRFDWTISCTSKLYQQAEIFFDTSDSDNYLVNAEVGIEAALNSSLSLVLLIRDTYDNLPAADREKNDIATITALKVAL